jgi:uncharacterized protein YraI
MIPAVAGALLLSGGVAAAAVTTTDTRLFVKPANNAQTLGTIPAGTSVEVLGCSKGWCKVTYAGTAGFAGVINLVDKGGSKKRPDASDDAPVGADDGPGIGNKPPQADKNIERL